MTDGERPELGSNAIEGQLGEALVEVAMLELGQIYRRQTDLDFGVDGLIELTSAGSADQASGRLVGVQVKRGLSVVRPTRYGRTLYTTEQHARYWLGHSLPIIVVHSEPGTRRLRWQHVNLTTLRRTRKGFAIDLPDASDLTAALPALQILAEAPAGKASTAEKVLLLPYDPETGFQVPDDVLGMAALEFSRAALRGSRCRVAIEISEEANLIASIDAITDMTAPTMEERRDAIIREDILARLRREADTLQRALKLLLTEPLIAELFGYRDDLLGEAVRRTVGDDRGPRDLQEKSLEAWPSYTIERPTVKFDVPGQALEHLYEKNSSNRVYIRMGAAGGQMVGDLHPDIVATRFLPILVRRLVGYADTLELSDAQAVSTIGIPPSLWLMGMA